ncbi:MAG: CDP-glucose 4,6-dehydratase [Bdellovibrionota bacterium]|mgnify:CR=1 FL=1
MEYTKSSMASMGLNPSQVFWRGKKVLVTGHTGFKGSWLSLWLSELGADVTGFSLPDDPSTPCLFKLLNEKNIKHTSGDIRKFEDIQNIVQKTQPEIIFHLAAQSLVRDSYVNPISTYATNVMGSIHLLEAARKAGSVSAFINVTSDKCYENKNWHWAYRENDPMGGHDPYSSSKGCVELLTASYRKSFLSSEENQDQMGLATVRAGNVIGGGDWATDRIVPDCIRAFSQGKPVVIRNPSATRPWQHVLDPISGYMLLAEKIYEKSTRKTFSDSWNFGPSDSDAKNVKYIVSQMVAFWENGAKWELDTNSHPHEALFLKVDSSKAKKELKWAHRLPVEKALRWTTTWYKSFYLENKNPKELCLEQIRSYCDTSVEPT